MLLLYIGSVWSGGVRSFFVLPGTRYDDDMLLLVNSCDIRNEFNSITEAESIDTPGNIPSDSLRPLPFPPPAQFPIDTNSLIEGATLSSQTVMWCSSRTRNAIEKGQAGGG